MTFTNELLNADLRVYRGGNKARLVARCYVACVNFDNRNGADPKGGQLVNAPYEEFRAAHINKSFAKLHEAFDQVLPAEFRAKYGNQYGNGGRGRQAKQTNGLTEAQQIKFDRFCKSPARLEKRFNKSVDYFLSNVESAVDGGEHLRAVAKRYQEAAEYCKSLIGDTQQLAALWNLGMRTGGDLESQIERSLKI